ncbi:hypothetical protein [Breznakiella homolactica]|nr:hypothetical protein [Breznakiella homolactica]
MSGSERKTWLEQIDRIHREQKAQRDRDTMTQLEQLLAARDGE